MKRITLIGMGPGNLDLLVQEACAALKEADVVVGAQRLLQSLPQGKPERICLAATQSKEVLDCLQAHPQGESVCIVVSGDGGFFSGAKKIQEALCGYDLTVIPGISAVQYFAAKVQKSWQTWHLVSAHGIQCDPAAEVAQSASTFFITGGKNTVATLCGTLAAAGWGSATVFVGERLSYPDEKITRGSASELSKKVFDDLSVMLVERDTTSLPAVASSEALWGWATGGIPDELFLRGKVPMTKQEVRAVVLAKLRISSEDTLYDIGSGTGSVAVEMGLLAKQGRVYAFERNAEASALTQDNVQHFGLTNVQVIEGEAPATFGGLPFPHAAFVGGSGGNLSDLVDALYKANPCVRICVAAITLETVTEATRLLRDERWSRYEVCQVCINRMEMKGSFSLMKAQNPIFLISAEGAGRDA